MINTFHEQGQRLEDYVDVDVLLVTTTDVEITAVLRRFDKKATNTEFSKGGINTYYDLGNINESRVIMVFCPGKGSGGPVGSQITVDDAIRELNPNVIIMIGIAFGVDNKKQQIGDILVSTGIMCYEHQRVGTTEDGSYIIIPRGVRANVSPGLLSLFRAGYLSFSETDNEVTKVNDIRFGILLSGEKLVDNFDYREQLKKNFGPEAIGRSWSLCRSFSARQGMDFGQGNMRLCRWQEA